MHPDESLRRAAIGAALGTAVAGGLLFHTVGIAGALAVLPLAVGLGGLTRERTWGGFAALAGATLVGVACAMSLLPSWAALAAAAGVAVAVPALVRAFRYDWSAALVWVALSTFGASGAGMAWAELDTDAPPPRLDPSKVVEHGGCGTGLVFNDPMRFEVDVRWDVRSERRHRRHRRRVERRWRW